MLGRSVEGTLRTRVEAGGREGARTKRRLVAIIARAVLELDIVMCNASLCCSIARYLINQNDLDILRPSGTGFCFHQKTFEWMQASLIVSICVHSCYEINVLRFVSYNTIRKRVIAVQTRQMRLPTNGTKRTLKSKEPARVLFDIAGVLFDIKDKMSTPPFVTEIYWKTFSRVSPSSSRLSLSTTATFSHARAAKSLHDLEVLALRPGDFPLPTAESRNM